MKNILILFCSIIFIGLVACKNETSESQTELAYHCPMACEGDKTYEKPGSCPICNMDLVLREATTDTPSDEISETSVFNLTSTWTNQNGEDIQLEALKGDVLVMVMIYTSCKAACPRLVADMRNIKERLPKTAKDNLQMIFVSIDPKMDTPERLKAFAEENVMDQAPWLFLRSSEDNTREFAAVMAVNYKKISPLDFSHSNIISVFNKQGEMVFQQEGLGVNSDATIQHIKEALAN